MSEQNQSDNSGCDGRVTELEERMAVVEAYQENIVDGQLMERLDELEEKTARINQLEDEKQELEAMVRDLKAQVEAVNDLADDQQSTPEKRAADVRMALIRRAKARSDGETRAAMHYKHVENALADLGHGTLHDPQLFTAMDDAADADGFTLGEMEKDGQMVRAVRVNLDELPGNAATNEINSGGGVASPPNTENTAD